MFMGDQWGNESTSGGQVQFSGDPDGLAPALQTLFAGLGTGGEQWSGIMTQYCDGAAVGATVCTEGDTQIPHPTGGVLVGTWYDDSSTGPASATAQEAAGLTGHELAAEAEAAASHFGNTDQASNRDTQYVIVSPTGTNPDGWNDPRSGYCAYHDDTHDASIDGGGAASGPIVAFTNLPYVPDAGNYCGAGTVTSPGALDGATEAASHEYAETVTDQFPEGNPAPGWINPGGAEVGDLCAYVSGGPGGMFELALGDGSVVVQGIWSNRAGGCSDGESDYTYTPTISTVGPATGIAGSSVTITGDQPRDGDAGPLRWRAGNHHRRRTGCRHGHRAVRGGQRRRHRGHDGRERVLHHRLPRRPVDHLVRAPPSPPGAARWSSRDRV